MARPKKMQCLYGHIRTSDTITFSGNCKQCEKLRRVKRGKSDEEKQKAKQRCLRRKIEILKHYSIVPWAQCCWSGCSVVDVDMLTLDHIENDGNAHLDVSGRRYSGTGLYQWIIKHQYPTGFQTLCMNHQLKKQLTR